MSSRSTETFLSYLLLNSGVRFLGYDGAHGDGKYVYDIYTAHLRTVRNRQVKIVITPRENCSIKIPEYSAILVDSVKNERIRVQISCGLYIYTETEIYIQKTIYIID